jgi:hypothetical protein
MKIYFTVPFYKNGYATDVELLLANQAEMKADQAKAKANHKEMMPRQTQKRKPSEQKRKPCETRGWKLTAKETGKI